MSTPIIATGSRPAYKRKMLIEQLEERALFDAVPIAPIDANMVEMDASAYLETVTNSITADLQTGSQEDETAENRELLFVDKSVEGFESVVAEFVSIRDVDVFFLNEGSSGLTQIANHLEGRADLAAIHIVSHGRSGHLQLGDSMVTQNQLGSTYAAELARIGQSLSLDGDILLYGCDLAADSAGESFIEEFSQLTNADVAASEDLTGSSKLGGDWELERQTGEINVDSLASEKFAGILLVTDDGFTIGTATTLGDGEIAVTPVGETGTSSLLYENAASANSGAISIDVRLTLIDTFDNNGASTKGTSNQLPVTFGEFESSPVTLSRNVGASVTGYAGHTAEILVEFLNHTDGAPLRVVGDFTFHDIDFVASGKSGAGAEAVTILADEMLSYQLSTTPTSQIDVVDNRDGTTTFTNGSGAGNASDEERWVSIQFVETTSHTLVFTSREGHTGYGLSTKNFTVTPQSFTQPIAQNDAFATDQDNSISSGNVITNDNGSGADSDPDGGSLSVTLVNGVAGSVGAAVAGSGGGLFTIDSNGDYSFNPNGEFVHLTAGQTATTTVTYQVGNGNGLADTARVTVVVTGVDDDPVNLGAIPAQIDSELLAIAPVDVSSFFDAVDSGETLTFSSGSSLPPGLSIDPVTGIISGTPASGSIGTYAVSILATDSNGETTTQTFNWMITSAGPTASDNQTSVSKGSMNTISGNVISDDDGDGVDLDGNDEIFVVSAVNGVSGNVGASVFGTYGTLVLGTDGAYTYSLDETNPAVSDLVFGSVLSDSFTYTIEDEDGSTSTAHLDVTIDAANQWLLVGDSSVVEGNIATYLLTLAESVDPGQSVSVDIGLTDVDTTNADHASFVAAVNSAISGRTDVTFDGTTLRYTAPSGYQVTSGNGGTFNDISTTGTGLNQTDDDSDSVAIGFDFEFYGTTHTSLYVGSNGMVTFGSGVNTYSNTALNNGISNQAGIAAFWDDLNPADADSDDVYWDLQGLPGNQEFIVQWNEVVPYSGSSGQDVTFQLVLFEGTADFEVRYLDTIAGGGNDNGQSATIGITDGNSSFLQYSMNSASVSSNSNLKFVAPSGSMDPIEVDLGTIDDSDGEFSEDYEIVLSNATGVSRLGHDYQVTTTILDNDNFLPTANDNQGAVSEDSATPATGNVLSDDDGSGIDSDPDGDILTVARVNGTAASVGVTLSGSYGSIVLNSNGSYAYTLDDSNATVNALGQDEQISESFSYSISDGHGGSDSATLTIVIDGSNDDPVIGGTLPSQNSMDAESIESISTSNVFSDPEGDSLSYLATGLPAGLSIDSRTGLITGTIDHSASQGGPASNGAYSVEVTANDGNGESVSTTFTWTVGNPGPAATDNSSSVAANATSDSTGNVLTEDDGDGLDADADGDSISVVSIDGGSGVVGGVTSGSYGSIQIDANGDYTYTVDAGNASVIALDATETLTETFDYTISDGEGGTSTATLTIAINGVNDTPIVGGTIGAQSDLDGATISTLDASAVFSDPDGDLLSYSVTGLPVGLSIDASTGLITGTIEHSASQGGLASDGVYSVEVTANDGNGGSVSTSFTWTVGNPGPAATDNSSSVAANATSDSTGNVLTEDDGDGLDSDVDGDLISVVSIDGGSGLIGGATSGSYGSIQIDANGDYAYTVDAGNASVIALDATETLTETFDYTISDGEGGTSTATLTITIIGVNDSPIVGGTLGAQSDLDAATISTLDASAVFSDPDGDLLSYSVTGLPVGLSIDASTGLITGTINHSASRNGLASDGVYSVEVTANDGNGGSVSTTFTWTVGNPGPAATDNSSSVAANATSDSTGNVLTEDDGDGVDADPDGDSISVVSIDVGSGVVGGMTTGRYGSIQIDANGDYAYTVDAGNASVIALDATESLIETFDYTISDGDGGTSTATLSITINGVNDSPIVGGTIGAQSDLDAATISTLDASAVFSDPDSDSLSYSVTGLPAGLSIDSSTGLITGTIDHSASQGGAASDGVYTVEVTAGDGNGQSVSTSFAWTVGNPGPAATDNSNSVAANSTSDLTGNVLADDNGDGVDADPDGDSISVVSIDVGSGVVGGVTSGSYGSIQIDANGDYAYTVDSSNALVIALDASQSLTETFSYTISDGEGGTSTATLSITINGVNDTPIVGGTLGAQTDLDAGTISTLDASAVFGDPDGDSLSYSATGLPVGLSIDSSTGLITGTVDHSASQGGPVSDGVYSVEVTANDGNGESVSTTFTWTVGNPGPVATNDFGTTTEGATNSGNVVNDLIGLDRDFDGDDLLVVSINSNSSAVGSAVAGSGGGLFTINASGDYSFNPNGEFEDLGIGESRDTEIDYTISDGEGGTSSATLTVQVIGSNDAPILGIVISTQANVDGETISAIDASASFSDPDDINLTYSAVGLPPGISVDSVTGLINGTLDSNASQGGPNLDGVYTVIVTATDSGAATITDTFMWSISNVAPTATNDFFTVNEDSTLSDTVASGDGDIDGDTLTFGLLHTGPFHGTLDMQSDGSFEYTPAPGFFGTDTFDYQVTDADGAVTVATAEIVVASINDAPKAGNDAVVVIEDTPRRIEILENDSDAEGDQLTVKITIVPIHGSLTIENDGSVTYTPIKDYHGPDSFEYEVCDPSGARDSAIVQIEVTPVNDDPEAGKDQFTTREDTPVLGTVATNDFDVESGELTFTLISAPDEGAFSFSEDGTFSFVPTKDFVGIVTFNYEVCDVFGGCDTATASINVTPINDAPLAVDDRGLTDEDTSVVINLLGNDHDSDAGDTMVVTQINGITMSPGDTVELSSGAIVTLNSNGTASYDSNGQFDHLLVGQSALDTFVYTIQDRSGETSTAESVIVINGENDVPVAGDDRYRTPIGTSIDLNVLDNDHDPESQPLAVVILSQPWAGEGIVNSDGTITYTPAPGFEGTVTLRYLVEDPDGGASEATITIDVVPIFQFDSFTNFAESPMAHWGESAVGANASRTLSQEIFTLAPEPVFSGFARPGTQIVGRIYDASGALVSEATGNTDPGGNWVMQFYGTQGHEFYRIELEPVTQGAADVYGYLGLNPGDNSYQSIESQVSYDRPLSIEGAMETSFETLQNSHRQNNDSLGFGNWDSD